MQVLRRVRQRPPSPKARPPEGELCSFHPPGVPGLEVWTVRECALLWRVYHDAYRVCVPMNPTRAKDYGATFKYRSRFHFLTNGTMFVVEPGGAHETTRLTGPGTFFVITFPAPLVDDAMVTLGVKTPHFREVLVSQTATISPFATLWRATTSAAPADVPIHDLLDRCLEQFLPILETPPDLTGCKGEAGRLARVRDYLHAHAPRLVSSRQLEEVSGLSRFHLSRLFRRRYGISPRAYQVTLRVQRAQEALRKDPSMELARLAAEVGFADQSHLGRAFLRATGLSPGRYRSAIERDQRQSTIVLYSGASAPDTPSDQDAEACRLQHANGEV